MRPVLMVAVIAALILVIPSRALFAQGRCGMHDRVVALLADKYEETQVAIGVTNGGGLVEVFAAPDGNTWTIVVTTPRGMSCMVAAGEGWRSYERMRPAPNT
jgi:hypothetical protein